MHRIITTLILITLLSPLSLWAQSPTATIDGRVLDPAKAVIQGAAIHAINVDTNVQYATQTNSAGLFTIVNLPPGTYRIEVSKQGFRTIVKPGVELHVQDVLALNFDMPVGSILESVTVSSGAPLVNSESAAVSTNVDRQFVKELPLNGRSFQTLFQLTPGVVIASTNAAEPGQFNINGQRANANYFTVDGVSANVSGIASLQPGQAAGGSLPGLTQAGGTNALVSVDDVQEFSIQTSGYAPEFGRTPGGQISISTRSGSNVFHGTAFEYLRNDVFDANDWFADNLGLQKAALRQNDFGGVFGGPILKNRTFFFFSYEGLRLRQPTTGISDVPSLLARQSASPSIQPFVNAFPMPTGADEGNGLAPADYAFSNPSHVDAASLRVDHTINQRLTIFARYNRSASDGATRGGFDALSILSHAATKIHTATAGLTWAVRPTLGNDLRFNWSWSGGSRIFVNDSMGGAVPLSLSTVVAADQNPADSQFILGIDSGNNSTLVVGHNSAGFQRQMNLIDTWSWQAGSHLIKFGVDYRRLTPEVNLSHYDQQVGFPGVSDLLAGQPGPGEVQVTSNFMPVDATYNNYSLFIQDAWKVTPRLTLTYGLRWDYNPAPSADGPNGLPLLTVVGIADLSNLAPAPAGTPLYHATVDNFAPRLGIAYNVRDSSSYGSVLRSGFGVFYDLGNGPTGNSFTAFPFTNASFPAAAVFPLTSADAAAPQPTLDPPYGFMVAYPKTLRQPYTYHWNLSLQQSIGSNQALTLSYVGAGGHSLLRQDILQAGGLSPNFSLLFYANNLGHSNYNAFEAQFRRRQTKRLDILASYTWAHSLDNVSKDSDVVSPLASGIVDPSANYGPSDFDIRHTGSFALDYQLPSKSHPGWAKAFLSGWAINTFLIARTSPPVNVIIFRDLGAGFTTYRPDLVPGVSPYISDLTAPGGSRFNPAAFTVAADPREGDLRRNALRGFPLVQQDFSLRRTFHLRESLQLQARLEAFNAFNHPNFASPDGLLGFYSGPPFLPLGSFGLSQSMFGAGAAMPGSGAGFNPLYQVGGPRSLQVALKLEF